MNDKTDKTDNIFDGMTDDEVKLVLADGEKKKAEIAERERLAAEKAALEEEQRRIIADHDAFYQGEMNHMEVIINQLGETKESLRDPDFLLFMLAFLYRAAMHSQVFWPRTGERDIELIQSDLGRQLTIGEQLIKAYRGHKEALRGEPHGN